MHRSSVWWVALVSLLLIVTGCASDPPLVLDTTLPTTTTAPPATTTTTTTTVATTADGVTTSAAPATTATTTAASTTPPVTGRPTETGPLVTWDGAPRYIHGANLPWVNFGQDFGGGVANGGASSAATMSAVDPLLGQAHDAGMNVVRWWMFPGQPTQFVLDGNGLPTALRSEVFTDVDAAVRMARANDMAYTFTLFSAPHDLPPDWLATEVGRERLALVLGTLFSRYRNTPEIMTWDVINEPEFDVWDGTAQADDVRALIKSIVDSAHATTSTPVSVGGARLDGLELLTDLGLDYYTIHWYDPMTGPDECLACANASDVRQAYGITQPIVVGEFYADPRDPARWDLWYDHGYAGALAWSLLPDKTSDGLTIDLAASLAFAERIGLT